jgi:hypothetical protein
MLVAYLRGLLTPDYPNGVRSVVRENLVLQAISLELDADALLNRVATEAAYAPLMQGNNANNLLKQHDKMLSLAHSARCHESQKSKTLKNVDINSIDNFIKTYKTIKDQGLLTPTR